MMIAGIGCRRGTSAAAIEAAIAAALAQTGRRELDALATAAFKGDEEGITAAAEARGIPLILVAQADLERVGSRATHSRRVAQLTGVGSVAEAAALAAAGFTARLLVARIVVGPATCAIALADAETAR